VNGPFAELQPLDERIAERGGGDVVLLDARWDACLKAAPVAASLARLSMPPNDQGKVIEPAEAVRRGWSGPRRWRWPGRGPGRPRR